MKTHARITSDVEWIRACLLIFFFCIQIQWRVGSKLTLLFFDRIDFQAPKPGPTRRGSWCWRNLNLWWACWTAKCPNCWPLKTCNGWAAMSTKTAPLSTRNKASKIPCCVTEMVSWGSLFFCVAFFLTTWYFLTQLSFWTISNFLFLFLLAFNGFCVGQWCCLAMILFFWQSFYVGQWPQCWLGGCWRNACLPIPLPEPWCCWCWRTRPCPAKCFNSFTATTLAAGIFFGPTTALNAGRCIIWPFPPSSWWCWWCSPLGFRAWFRFICGKTKPGNIKVEQDACCTRATFSSDWNRPVRVHQSYNVTRACFFCVCWVPWMFPAMLTIFFSVVLSSKCCQVVQHQSAPKHWLVDWPLPPRGGILDDTRRHIKIHFDRSLDLHSRYTTMFSNVVFCVTRCQWSESRLDLLFFGAQVSHRRMLFWIIFFMFSIPSPRRCFWICFISLYVRSFQKRHGPPWRWWSGSVCVARWIISDPTNHICCFGWIKFLSPPPRSSTSRRWCCGWTIASTTTVPNDRWGGCWLGWIWVFCVAGWCAFVLLCGNWSDVCLNCNAWERKCERWHGRRRRWKWWMFLVGW